VSIFSNFTGGKSRKDIARASAEAEQRLAAGRTAALGELSGGETGAKGYVNQGYDAGRGSVNQGYDTARGDLSTQYGRAEDSINQALTNVSGTLQPFIQSGTWAQDLYDTALGKGGAGAATDFYQNYAANDPYRAFRDEQANKQIQAQFNANGLGGSGRMATAVSRASLERGTQDLQTYLTRLENQGARGGQYASQLAGYQSQAGNNIAGIRQGLGDRLGTLETNRGTTLGNMDVNRGNTLSDITNSYAQNRAGLESGYGQQLAANRINQGNAMAQTRSTGMNNLLSLGGLALNAVSGMPNFGQRSTTSPGTAMNGGWSTTTTKNQNPLLSLFG
jgi:hypothetical protein